MDMKLSHCMRIAAYGMRPNNQERKWGGGGHQSFELSVNSVKNEMK